MIEVVVSLALLASLVAGMVVAYSAHHRQALLATRRHDAIEAADQLLMNWYASGDPQVPRNSHGIVPGSSGLIWRTEVVHQNVIETLPVEIVRLQIFPASPLNRNRLSTNGQFKRDELARVPQPLSQVDVILPIPQGRL